MQTEYIRPKPKGPVRAPFLAGSATCLTETTGYRMKRPVQNLLILLIMLLVSTLSRAGTDRIVIDDFEQGLKKGWQTKDFKGATEYRVVQTERGRALKAVSRGTASGLIFKYKYDTREYPYLSWWWKVENIIKKGDATKKEGDDYAARIYVIFPHWFPPLTRSLNYIWANRLPRGSAVKNTYFSRAIMIAVESGNENIGKWIHERRNVYEDFKNQFGDEPPEAGAIAIMTDTDQTGENAVAYYDDIVLSK